jgi:2-polyprenyl-6-methoxyphenol hydroxylase-like FAD-dependent oxidoreductase
MTAVSKVLIVGAGVGGLAAAVAFRQGGIIVDIIEKTPDWAVYGVGIIQPNNTLRALDKIGLAQACVENGAPFSGWSICDSAGKELTVVAAPPTAAPNFPATNGITRPKLQKILGDAAKDHGASLRLGVVITEMNDHGDRVDVSFSDGSQASYDFVIGCDGVYSDTRKRLFGDVVTPTFTGQGVWRYNLPRPADMSMGEAFAGRTSKGGTVPLSPDLMYFLLVTAEPGNPMMDPSTMAQAMRARMAEYTGRVADMRDQIVDNSAVVYRPLESAMLPAPWYKGRAIVIGDAAHATTPHLAQGAAMAIEDAVLLSELLGQDRPLADLLAEFMRRRFDRVKYVVDCSGKIGNWELEEWAAGVPDPQNRAGTLVFQATHSLLEDY